MTANLLVDRTELLDALRLLKRMARTRKHEAVLTFLDGWLCIELGGYTAKARAEGDWPRRLRLPAGVVAQLAIALPAGDPVHLEVDNGRLRLGSFALSCTVDETDDELLRLPANADMVDVLALAATHSRDRIASAGLLAVLEEAEQRRERAIEQAARLLQPFGVRSEEVRSIVTAALRRHLEA